MLPNISFAAESCWPDWDRFKTRFMNEGGRIVDRGSERSHSTSEGQSYGLFFALVAKDQASFELILKWTEANLANNDLTARLPAWLWGRRDDGTWGILDDNAASDSDLWIVYALSEAGRLWQEPRYLAIAELLAARILREETEILPNIGRTLLPGPKGFKPKSGVWRLNPSYLPIQLLRRMATLYPKSEWKKLAPGALELLVRSAPRGFAPEWALYQTEGGFQPDTQTQAMGSYNAIRVYLWAGMLAPDEPARRILLQAYAPMIKHIVTEGTPPREVNTRTGTSEGVGSAGFSAALLPILAAAKEDTALRQQALRITALAPHTRDDNYYDQVLTLFGRGWHDGRFRFSRDGRLQANCLVAPPSR